MSQEELADRAGLTAKAIGALERGERRRPYPHTVRALADALGLDEADRAELVAAGRPERPRQPTGLGPSTGLPVAAGSSSAVASDPTPLVGRGRELFDVVTALTTGPTRLLTVTGPGGVGKSRLALDAARRVADLRGVPLVVVELAPVSDPALVVPTIAQALAVPPSAAGDARTPVQRVAAALGAQWRLLLLDNLEHLLPAASDLALILDACPGVVVLATSRAPLRIRHERDFPLAPLDLPARPDLAGVTESAAARLLLDRARTVSPGFALTERTAPAVAQICRRLDGLPLALELAAAHARFLGPEALLDRLDQALSAPRARDVPERHSTMRATLDWSHDLLTLDEQRGLRRLAVFAGGFTLDAADVVLGDDLDAFTVLAGLVDQSVVQPETDRYRLLEPVRQYARARLDEAGESDAAADRLAGWVGELAQDSRRRLRTDEQAETLDLLQVEHGNIRAALVRLLDTDRPDAAARVLSHTWLSWALRGTAAEGLDWTKRVRHRPGWSSSSAGGRAHLELAGAGLAYATGDLDATGEAAATAVAMGRAHAPEVVAEALVLLGSARAFMGSATQAEESLREAERLACADGDEWVQTHARLADGQ